MLLTTASLVFAPALLLRALRTGWYALHLLLTLGAAWWLEQHYAFRPFHAHSFLYAAGVHLTSITLLTFVLYGWDKRAARRDRWRIPERTLHAFALVGGTLGAVAGSKFFRHKTLKSAFRQQFWLVVIIQGALLCAAWLWLMG